MIYYKIKVNTLYYTYNGMKVFYSALAIRIAKELESQGIREVRLIPVIK